MAAAATRVLLGLGAARAWGTSRSTPSAVARRLSPACAAGRSGARAAGGGARCRRQPAEAAAPARRSRRRAAERRAASSGAAGTGGGGRRHRRRYRPESRPAAARRCIARLSRSATRLCVSFSRSAALRAPVGRRRHRREIGIVGRLSSARFWVLGVVSGSGSFLLAPVRSRTRSRPGCMREPERQRQNGKPDARACCSIRAMPSHHDHCPTTQPPPRRTAPFESHHTLAGAHVLDPPRGVTRFDGEIQSTALSKDGQPRRAGINPAGTILRTGNRSRAGTTPPDPVRAVAQIPDIAERSQRLVAEFLPRQSARGIGMADPLNIGGAFFEMTQRMMADPTRLVQAQLSLWQDYLKLWQRTTQRFLGGAGRAGDRAAGRRPALHATRRGPRTRVFDYIKQSYLLTARWMQATVKEVEGLDEQDRAARSISTRGSSSTRSRRRISC